MNPSDRLRFPVDDPTVREWIAPTIAALGTQGGVLVPAVATDIVGHILGAEWIRRGMRPAEGESAFLEFPRGPHIGKFSIRVARLAEMLLNLQTVSGFERRLAELRSHGVEDAVAELEAAARMHARGWSCRFVERSNRRGLDYDIEVALPCGANAAVEVKCKLESTACSQVTIKNVLGKARQQLPTDRAGVVYLRLPRQWATASGTAETLESAVRDTFRNTGRISSVCCYWEVFMDLPDRKTARAIVMRDFLNEDARFRPSSLATMDRREDIRPWRSLHAIVPELSALITQLA